MEFIIWWGGGIIFVFLAYRNFTYKKVEPSLFIISEKLIKIYREQKSFSDEQIIKAVKMQGGIIFVLGSILIIIGLVRYLLTLK